MMDIQTFLFDDDGRIPNNPTLPLVVYAGALAPSGDLTRACRELFARNGWGGIWVNGVYRYHHYHSLSHEVLGCVGGTARIQFGGPQGEILQIQAGDVVAIPAGVGHFNTGASADFRVVGAYPPGQEDYDVRRGEPSDRPEALENIQRVPLPTTDPVAGANGPLLEIWSQ